MSILSTLNKLTGKQDKNVLAALNSLTGKTADDIEEAIGNLGSSEGGGSEGGSEFGRTVNISSSHMYLDACPISDLSNVQYYSDLAGQHDLDSHTASADIYYIATTPGVAYPDSSRPGILLCTDGTDGYAGFTLGYTGDFYAAGGLYVSISLQNGYSDISNFYEWDPERYPDQRAVLLYQGHSSGVGYDNIKATDVTDCISAGLSNGEPLAGALLIHVPLYDLMLGDNWSDTALYIYGLGAVPGA